MASVKDLKKKLAEELPPKIMEAVEKETKGLKADKKKEVIQDVLKRYQNGKIESGEPVGLLAAQAVGERATQMVLRTFHIAGLTGELSVPQGMPRLKELLEVKHHPEMETCRIQLKGKKNKKEVREIARDIEEIKLKEVAEIKEDFAEKKIIIEFDQDKINKRNIDPKEIAQKVKDKIRKKPEKVTKEVAEFKPRSSNLKSLRRYTRKVRNTRVKGIKGVKRATIVERNEGKNKTYEIHTDGTNLKQILKMPEVDSTKTDSNSIREIQKVLGIEAARQVLKREIKENLEAQNIKIDERHVMLIADTLTRDGELKAIGRHGVSGEKASVLANASFETQMRHLLRAAKRGETDPLKGVAERMIIGETIPVGTGSVELRMLPGKKTKSDEK